MKYRLPSKPSDLFTIAVDDLSRVEKLKKYEIEMGEWASKSEDENTCSVCMAGAVMALRSHPTVRKQFSEDDFILDPYDDRINENAYYAINNFREYDLTEALDSCKDHSTNKAISKKLASLNFDIVEEEVLAGVSFVNYYENSTKFKRNMRTIIRRLKKKGL